MNATEAIAARTKLGLAVNQLAVELGFIPATVEAWERGEVKVPAAVAGELAWRTAQFDRIAALEASGLARCAWIDAIEKEPFPTKSSEISKLGERIMTHVKSCETCQSRERYVADRFGPMPPRPMPGWIGVLAWIAERVNKLPPLARPAAWGALAFGAYSLVRLVFMLPGLMRDPSGWPIAIVGITLSCALGGALGLIYGLYKKMRDR